MCASLIAPRTLAEEDIEAAASGSSSSRPLSEAAGNECEEIYAPGTCFYAASFAHAKAFYLKGLQPM
jgi:hypothetical protein